MAAICLNCHVSGRVQGVFYRRFCAEEAKKLGITGWVKNLPNGGVEMIICGEKSILDTMIKTLWQGPPKAWVEDITTAEVAYQDWDHFEVKYD